jgi:N-terminal domain in fatty acid synthase subunit beta
MVSECPAGRNSKTVSYNSISSVEWLTYIISRRPAGAQTSERSWRLLPALTAELENHWEATLDLFARFWGFVRGSPHGDQQSFRARTYFTATYLTERDVHSVVATCNADVHQSVLSSYFLALAALKDAKVADISHGPASGDASVFALFFGGQSVVPLQYLQAIRGSIDIYRHRRDS